MTKLKLFLSVNAILAACLSYGMDPPKPAPFVAQTDFNAYSASIGQDIYGTMNAKVSFSESSATNSAFWETHQVFAKRFFVKKRGVLLSDALKDLLEVTSNTAFECTTAQLVFFWHLLLAPEFAMDEMIERLEKTDPSFALPLVPLVFVEALESQSAYYRFAQRTGPFTFTRRDGQRVEIDIQTDHTKLLQLRANFNKLPIFDILCSLSSRDETVIGGITYLPNVKGVTGPDRGENLVRVSSPEGSLYFGFGPFFKDGAKTLAAIGENLASKCDKNLYTEQMQELELSGQIGETGKNCHALQYLMDPLNNKFLDLQKFRAEISKIDLRLKDIESCKICSKTENLSKCGKCRAVAYCSRDCQVAHWPKHKATCQPK